MIASAVIVKALNHLLLQAEWARLRLHAYAGQSLQVELGPWKIGFAITPEGLFHSHSGEAPSVMITFPPNAPLLALQSPERLMQEARIAGHAEFAETLSFVFRNLNWDVEADLAPLVGDILAHRLVQAGRALTQQLRKSATNLSANFSEYARDELHLLASPRELSAFSSTVTVLRDDLARLEKRLQLLERRSS